MTSIKILSDPSFIFHLIMFLQVGDCGVF